METSGLSSSHNPLFVPGRYLAHWRLPQLPFGFSERKLLLGMLDLALINVALGVTLWVRSGPAVSPAMPLQYVFWFALLSGLWLVIANILNLYDLALAAKALGSCSAAGRAALLTALLYLLIPFLTPGFPEHRLEFLMFLALAPFGVGTWRSVYAKVLAQPVFHERILIVGAGEAGRALAQVIAGMSNGNGNPYLGCGYQILGYIDDDPRKLGAEIGGIPIMGDRRDLVRIARDLKPDSVVIAITDYQNAYPELIQGILECQELGICVLSMTAVYEALTGRVAVEHAGRNLHVLLPLSVPAKYRSYFLLRRAGEIVLCLCVSITILPLIAIVWLANRLVSPGPLFYFQERVGKGGWHFRLVKFRSMRVDAEKSGAVWAGENDPRITPIGQALRKTRLDELPQIWNVLKGDMSLIGPRPERPEFVTRLSQEIPFYRLRHAVKPGITGWAQVNYPYGASVHDSFVKLQYDLYYVKHQGPFLDLSILLRTIQVVLGLKGR